MGPSALFLMSLTALWRPTILWSWTPDRKKMRPTYGQSFGPVKYVLTCNR